MNNLDQINAIALAQVELENVTNQFIEYIRNEGMKVELNYDECSQLVDECDRDLSLAIHCAISINHAAVNNLHIQKNFTVLADEARAEQYENYSSSFEMHDYDY